MGAQALHECVCLHSALLGGESEHLCSGVFEASSGEAGDVRGAEPLSGDNARRGLYLVSEKEVNIRFCGIMGSGNPIDT